MSNKEDQLEAEFLALSSTIGEEIKRKVEQAVRCINEARELADRHGIPFYSRVSELGQAYVPNLFADRFDSLDKKTVGSLLDMRTWDLNHSGGWKHSQIGC